MGLNSLVARSTSSHSLSNCAKSCGRPENFGRTILRQTSACMGCAPRNGIKPAVETPVPMTLTWATPSAGARGTAKGEKFPPVAMPMSTSGHWTAVRNSASGGLNLAPRAELPHSIGGVSPKPPGDAKKPDFRGAGDKLETFFSAVPPWKPPAPWLVGVRSTPATCTAGVCSTGQDQSTPVPSTAGLVAPPISWGAVVLGLRGRLPGPLADVEGRGWGCWGSWSVPVRTWRR